MDINPLWSTYFFHRCGNTWIPLTKKSSPANIASSNDIFSLYTFHPTLLGFMGLGHALLDRVGNISSLHSTHTHAPPTPPTHTYIYIYIYIYIHKTYFNKKWNLPKELVISSTLYSCIFFKKFNSDGSSYVSEHLSARSYLLTAASGTFLNWRVCLFPLLGLSFRLRLKSFFFLNKACFFGHIAQFYINFTLYLLLRH